MANPLVNIEELSRLIDGQLSPDERAGILTRLDKCPVSRQLYDGMSDLNTSLAKGIIESGAQLADEEQGDECPDDQTLMLLQENHLAPAMVKKIETHITSCRLCLTRLMTEVRSAVSMNNANWKDLPETVASDPRLGGLAKKRPTPKHEPKPLVNLQEKSNDAAQHIDFEYTTGGKILRDFKLINGSFTLSLTTQNDKTVNVEVTIRNQNGTIANSEVIVWDRKSRRKIFRGLSSSNGKIALRRLHDNTYDLHSQDLDFILRLTIINP